MENQKLLFFVSKYVCFNFKKIKRWEDVATPLFLFDIIESGNNVLNIVRRELSSE